MGRALAIGACALLALPAAVFAVASDSQLEALLETVRAEEASFEQAREQTDVVVRDNTRVIANRLLGAAAMRCATVTECRAVISNARLELARPGPADSAAKTVHTVTRQMGAQGIQSLRRIQTRIEALIGD